MNAELTTIGIIDAAGTDGYALVNEYSDGTQASAHGWYSSFQDAWNYAADRIEETSAAGVVIENWTESWTNEEIAETLDCLLGQPLIEATHDAN